MRTCHTIPPASVAYDSFGNDFLDLSRAAHGSIARPGGGVTGGVVGGVLPGLPGPPVRRGGVEPGSGGGAGGVLPPPGYPLPGGGAPRELLDPVPPPGPSGGPPPPDALVLVCRGVHSLRHVTALEVALFCCIGVGGGGGGGIRRDGTTPGGEPNPGGARPSGTPPGAQTILA